MRVWSVKRDFKRPNDLAFYQTLAVEGGNCLYMDHGNKYKNE